MIELTADTRSALRRYVKRSTRALIVCGNNPVHRTVIYLANELVKDGISVDMFFYNSPTDDSIDLIVPGDIDIVVARSAPVFRTSSKILRRAIRLIRYVNLIWMPGRTLYGRAVIARLRDILRSDDYKFILAVEKGGLSLTGQARVGNEIALLYYSLELYTRKHPLLKSDRNLVAMRRLEKRYSSNVATFIVQDQSRWDVLKKDLALAENSRKVFFPVGEPEYPPVSKSSLLHEMLSISTQMSILLYYGVVRPERGVIEIARTADSLPRNWIMVFHGFCSDDTATSILSQTKQHRVRLSRTVIPGADRERLIASATIGLAIYSEPNANEQLTGFASEKLALYLKCGLPVISHDNSTFQHVSASGAGVMISTIDGIPAAVEHIAADYTRYSQSAAQVYRKYYRLETIYPNVRKAIVSLLN